MAEHRSPTVHRWSQRDQLTSYAFQRRRLIRSFIEANPESTEQPDRRLWAGMAGGTLIAVLALAVMAVLGILRPGNSTAWRSGDSIIVEKETGTRFVLDKNQVLHPVVNYTSAVLFLGSRAKVSMTSRGSLSGAARGAPVGIPGAPDALPAEKDLVDGPWTTCSAIALDGRTSAPVVSTDVGAPPTGESVGDGDGLLVQDVGDDSLYLLTDGLRHQIVSPAVEAALGWEQVDPLPVATSWLNTVPAGSKLDRLTARDAGSPGPPVAGRPAPVGTVYEVNTTAGPTTFWLLFSDGLVEVNPTAAALLTAGGSNKANPRGRTTELTVDALSSAPRSQQPAPGDTLPAQPPVLLPPLEADGESVCATMTPGSSPRGVEIRISPSVPDNPSASDTPDPSVDGAPPAPGADTRADAVRVTPGVGALVAAAGGERLGAVYLVTDLGILYPLESPDVAGVLGYGNARPTQVPAPILRLLPVGPVLGTGPTATAEQPADRVQEIGTMLGG